jgi:hypothetical protein
VHHEPRSRWTPETQAQLMALWEQGLVTTDIAQRLGVTRTAAHRRARSLQRRGVIQPRSSGGTSLSQQVLTKIVGFLLVWANEPEVNEVFVGQLRHLAMDVARQSQHRALERAHHQHERN